MKICKHIRKLIFATFICCNQINAQDCNIATPLPYYESFENTTIPALPNCYVSQSVAYPINWASYQRFDGTKFVSFNDQRPDVLYKLWLFTPKFQLLNDKSYKLKFSFKSGTSNSNDAPDLWVYYGICQNNGCMTNPIWAKFEITNQFWKKDSVFFTPQNNGNYFIGFYHVDEHTQVHNANASFIDSINLEESIALPVNLSPLRAILTNNMITLNWKTYSEQNNMGFDIEQSRDGKNFDRIGFVSSKAINGISNLENTYTWQFSYPSHAFYRLKQIDKNGHFEYSNIVTSTVLPNRLIGSFKLMENNNANLKLFVITETINRKQFVIIDGTGRRVLNETKQLYAGDNLIQIDITKLAMGNYYIMDMGSKGKPIAFIKL